MDIGQPMKEVAVLCIAQVAICSMSHAQIPGQLDPSFGVNGYAVTTMCMSNVAHAMALQPDGKILIGGKCDTGNGDHFALARFNADGTVDSDFGTNGTVTTEIGPLQSHIWSLAVQSDGKIVAAGGAWFSGSSFALARYLPNGTLDNSFGDDGVVTDPIVNSGYASDVTLQPDGKILVSGTATDTEGPDTSYFAVVRYTTAGSLDNGFGVGGKLLVGVGSSSSGGDVTIQPDGKIIAAGRAGGFAVIRCDQNGVLDATFAGDGIATIDASPDFQSVAAVVLAVAPDGRIVAAGGPDYSVVRLLPDGTPDNSFNDDGRLTLQFGNDPYTVAGLAVQSDGKPLVVGRVLIDGWPTMRLARFTTDGELDDGFWAGGIVKLFPADACDLTMQPDGKILVCGAFVTGEPGVARYFSGLEVGITELSLAAVDLNLFPDPASDRAVISYTLAHAQLLKCDLYDPNGQWVRALSPIAWEAAGAHQRTLDLTGLAAGSYFVRLGSAVSTSSVQFVKR
jgi:uncharacterized delta-60 repeat protein